MLQVTSAPMTAARRHDPEASRSAILGAAERLFLERGFAGASMSEIAKGSGVTKSLIHHHFGSKEALWSEVKRTRFADYYDRQMRLFASTGATTPRLLRESMEVYFRFLRDNPDTVRMMSWLQLEGDRDCTDMVEELRDVGIQRIQAAQEAGIVRRDVPAPFILMTFLGLVQAWFHESSACSAGADPSLQASEAYLQSAWRIFATGVLVDPDAPT
jgi:TetR/AcrR family transcriptional regulator